MFFVKVLQPHQNKILSVIAINQITAAKLIVLWNLPAIYLLASACEVGTTIFAYECRYFQKIP